jgi:[protein-PII] uridylyltransferase
MGVTDSIMEQREALREYRKNRYLEIKKRQESGATGGQVVASITGLADEIIDQLYRKVLASAAPGIRWKLEDGFAIVALGGYGRGELAPFSDIDLMFLHRDASRDLAQTAATDLLQTLWDIGYRVGHSLRTVDDCIAMGKKDLTIRTSQMEARFLAGNQRLFERFRARYERKVVLKHPASFVEAKIRDRQSEYQEYGTTVYLLEPHVKMSQGGLRDLHLLRWAALSRYHTASLETVKHHGLLSSSDYTTLTEAQEFLWWIRNELHFEAGRCQDNLTFHEQIRLSRLLGFEDDPRLLGVERFMRRYYEQTTALLEVSRSAIDRMLPKSFVSRINHYFTRRSVNEHFTLAGNELSVRAESRPQVFHSMSQLLRLFRIAQIHGARLSPEIQVQVRNALGSSSAGTPRASFKDPETARVFIEILNAPGSIARSLRELHRFRLLERIIPAFSHARGLMQFNEYHKYTVDEHCLRAVEEAEALRDQDGRTAQVFREIQRRDILYLALLIHDLGKGLGEDHTEVGIRIAQNIADELALDAASKGLLVYLVRHHLLMTRIAFRRDLTDEKILIQLAKTVATPEALKMLYILTLSDIAAVGPGTLTAWKRDLLSELFENTLEILTGEKVVGVQAEKVKQVRDRIADQARAHPAEWVLEQLSAMTPRYLLATPPDRILRHLDQVRQLPSAQVLVDAEYDPQRLTTEYTVYTSDALTPGIFYKITGVLAAKGLQILGATITTWENATVVDSFQVQDLDFAGAPTRTKMDKVGRAIQDVLLGRVLVEELLNQGRRIPVRPHSFPMAIPTQVEVDNGSSEQFTIIEAFAQDRQGLLYVIARAMFELGLSVHTAKVSTQLDQIVDVFYVTDRSGQKITDALTIDKIKKKLTDEIERFLQTYQRPSFIGS